MRLSDESQSTALGRRRVSARRIAVRLWPGSGIKSGALRRAVARAIARQLTRAKWIQGRRVYRNGLCRREVGQTRGHRRREAERTRSCAAHRRRLGRQRAHYRHPRQTLFERFGALGKIRRRGGQVRTDDDRIARSDQSFEGSGPHRHAPSAALPYRVAVDRYQADQERDERGRACLCQDLPDEGARRLARCGRRHGR